MSIESTILAVAEAEGNWSSIMADFWPVVALALCVSLLATPLCRRFALKKGIVDRPDDFLKPHGKPIPYLGGVAIFAGWLSGILVAMALPGIDMRPRLMTGVAMAGSAIMLTGLFDDLRAMSPKLKLACNIAAGLLLLAAGLGGDLVNVVAQVTGVQFGEADRWLQWTYSVPVALFIIVGACNATNLIDGLDGLCTGVLGIIALGWVILASYLRVISPDLHYTDERIVVAMATFGAAIGFLPFNRNPARIFMGDAGSMLLGLNAAILILMFGEAGKTRWMLGAVMVFGLPISDMLLTLARRWRNGRPLMSGDRSHFYDQLCDRGLSVRRVVTISYLLTMGFALVGVSVIFLRTRHAILAYCVAIMVVVAAVWKFDMAGIEKPQVKAAAGKPSNHK